MTKNPIYPMAFKLSPNQRKKLYYVGFPTSWKKQLFLLEQMRNPKYRSEISLNTTPLRKLLDSWMSDFVSIKPLKKDSDDTLWLTSSVRVDEERLRKLTEIIKIWITAIYLPRAGNPKIPTLVKKLCAEMQPSDLEVLLQEKTVLLTNDNGTVSEEAYDVIPLMVANELVGNDIFVNSERLHLMYVDKTELISQPMTDSKSGHQYAYVFHFSVQTTPPDRQALLLCHISIRRWVPGITMEEGKMPYLPRAVNVHIKVSESRYCRIPIQWARSKSISWSEQDEQCYNLYAYEQLPNINTLFASIGTENNTFLLPYQNGVRVFEKTKIGIGVPIKDKAELFFAISALISAFAVPAGAAEPLRARTIPVYSHPQDYPSQTDFRSWVAKCAETNEIHFELYGLLNDEKQNNLLDILCEKLFDDFGETDTSELKIRIDKIDSRNMTAPLENTCNRMSHSHTIKDALSPTKHVTACFFIIPPADAYIGGGDPKASIRNGFAKTGRIVQFITTEDNTAENKVKINHTVYDLYRQLGVVSFVNFKKTMPMWASVPCRGMYLFKQIQGCRNKAYRLPIFVTVDLLSGKTRVQCKAFSKHEVTYREACLEVASLYWREDLKQLCDSASRTPVKDNLLALKSTLASEDKYVFLAQTNGDIRPVWNGVSDKAISGYSYQSDYCPEEIDVGDKNNPYKLSLDNSGIRILRIHSNDEVPDYFTSKTETEAYKSATGIFGYDRIFWSIPPKPNDKRYNRSGKSFRTDNPTADFAEKKMIEIYPLQLQQDDDALEWVRYVNALRSVSVQFDTMTILPLPLHLANVLKEYIFEQS